MKPKERYTWLLSQVEKRISVDVLDSDFVDLYISECGKTKIGYTNFGAHKAPRLGRDLSSMYRLGMLSRCIVGLSVDIGFPTWVYSYSAKKN